jgi:hypothetical protein
MLECATDRQTWPPQMTSSPSRISKTIPEFHAQVLSGQVRPFQHTTGNNFHVTVLPHSENKGLQLEA